ncbi:hypothetical protein K437DRAFT_259507 [Tilletiaria anomala UBC 951]|uniref:Uncharacterized protein n=1 Tax=Tilletiaria anomala (strain ATCC 24038 / CBS 436.72 / UBC 951) TaxID=1037660 RepID=A0A066V9H2_TILAU|nr:uncharacterized protein K437DRAFT_259507 [Tilletiaria anomala UBC 951]KDN38141.1 hypothetical protein K437DRAFT_259507 [Tilletiaria anomala UBC 951]
MLIGAGVALGLGLLIYRMGIVGDKGEAGAPHAGPARGNNSRNTSKLHPMQTDGKGV